MQGEPEAGRVYAEIRDEAATAVADSPGPATKNFLDRFVTDFHSPRRATVGEQWTGSLRFPTPGLANATFTRGGPEVAAVAAGAADTGLHAGRAVLRIHPSPDIPCSATADLEPLACLAGGEELRRERRSLTLRFESPAQIPAEFVVRNPTGLLITGLQADLAPVTGEER